MKNLFIISEDERKRILGLHENATKKQYLGEAKVVGNEFSGTNIQFDKETKYTQEIFKLVYGKTNVDETKLTDVITSIPDLNTFIKVNDELKNAFKLMKSDKHSGLDSIIARTIDFGLDAEDVERLRTYFKRIGVTTNHLGQDFYVFGDLSTNKNGVTNPDQTKKTDTSTPAQREMTFATKYGQTYPCVTGGKKIKYTSGNGGFYYQIGDIAYYVNGEYKNTIKGTKGTFKCNGKQISLDGETAANPDVTPKPRVVPTTSDELLQGKGYLKLNDSNSLVKQVQNNLISADEFVTPTGTFDKETYDAVKSFQSKNGLKSDGIVGKKTWSILSNVKPETMTPKEIDRIS
jgi:hypothetical protein